MGIPLNILKRPADFTLHSCLGLQSITKSKYTWITA